MSDAKFRVTCPHCKGKVLDFDLYDEKPILCSGCKVLVEHPGAHGHHPGIEMLRAVDRSQDAMEHIFPHLGRENTKSHRFVGIEEMTPEDLPLAVADIAKECFKRMSLPADDWPLRLNSILDLLGLGHTVLPPGTKERDDHLRRLIDGD